MSWVSTLDYYRLLNEAAHRDRGRQHSAELLVASVDFQKVVDAQAKGDWTRAGALLADKARGLERAGAGAWLIASNTMHLVYAQVQAAVAIPGLNIFDATADAVRARGFATVGLLGTRYTMGHAFYREEYERRGVRVLVPKPDDAKRVNEIIFRELIHGEIKPESRTFYEAAAARLADAGAEGVILGCTEIGLLLGSSAQGPPLFDTTALHAAMGALWLKDLTGFGQSDV